MALPRMNISDLPTEILQSIADYQVDLPTLRLVSRTFNATFFDAFASQYLSELQCFAMDSKRLERLKAITSRPHLARKIKKTTICLDPLEGKPSKDIPVALLSHFEDQFEIGQILARMCLLETKYEPFMRHDADEAWIASILRDLKAAQCPNIALDCHIEMLGLNPDLREAIESKFPHFMRQVFFHMLCSGLKLSEFRLNDTRFLGGPLPSPYEQNQISEFCRDLKMLTVDADLEDVKRVFGNPARNEPCLSGGEWPFKSVLRGANVLEHLHATGPFDPRRARSSSSIKFTSTMLNTNPFTTLRKLDLERIQCDPDVLCGALEGWSNSLEDLRFYIFSLETEGEMPGYSWERTFRGLLRLSKLQSLKLDSLLERNHGNAVDNGSLDLRKPGDMAGSVSGRISAEGFDLIASVLRFNIESGITFSWKLKI